MLSTGPDAGFHTLLVETRRLCQIEDIEFDLVYLLVSMHNDILVGYLKVVPLGMAPGVHIVLKP